MSDEKQLTVEPVIDETQKEWPDVVLQFPKDTGLKEIRLPNMNTSKLPLEMTKAIFIIKSKVVLSEEEQYLVLSTCLAYFEQMQPNLWNHLRKTENALGWLAGILKTWAIGSGIDPKAFTSLSSTKTTTQH